MPKKPSIDKTNQTIARGIAGSAATAMRQAHQHHQPLVVWRDGKITEVHARNPDASSRNGKESKPRK